MGDKESASPSPDTRKKWHELVDAINNARTVYYQHDAPSISDSEYDSVFRELEALEERYPELASGESPTQTVGGQASEMFEAVTHLVRLYSLDNAFDEAELSAWLERVEKGLGRLPDLLCEVKIDGLAVDIVYRDGRLASVATRGDGVTGEDITYNAQFIDAIPESLDSADPPGLVEIRGEVFFSTANFERINDEQMASSVTPFANPRNASAGTNATHLPERSGSAWTSDGWTSTTPGSRAGAGRPPRSNAWSTSTSGRWVVSRRWGSRPMGSELAKESMSPRKARRTHYWQIWASP